MRYPFTFRISSAMVLGLCLGATGCVRAPAAAPTTAPISVMVSNPVERDVTDYAEFPAHITAVNSVDVRALVSGYLNKLNFKEGALVKQGDVLFELDARPYQAALDQAKAKLRSDEAQLRFDEAEHVRDRNLFNRGALSQADLDRATAARDKDLASIASDKAQMAAYELDLIYARLAAPISGRISRYYVTVGNLVQAGTQGGGTLLTTIVSVDPIYAYFDMDEGTVQRLRRSAREGRAKAAEDPTWPVSLGLATEEEEFPHQGTINFVDNQVNAKTGTLRVRGVFPNRDESLTAGYFARVRIPTGRPHRTLLVSDRAQDNDQGQKVLYVLNNRDEVVSRAVRVGALHDGLRAIEDGLKPGERVIVSGLQQVRPGVIVAPTLLPMPTSGVRNPDDSASVAKSMPDSRPPTPSRRPR
jgi:RND family efflux transporter MFP subunit